MEDARIRSLVFKKDSTNNGAKMNLIGLSLFANVGISETNLRGTSLKIKVANELLPERSRFYSFNHPKSTMINGDITKDETIEQIITTAKKNKVNFILATPPCQGMSSAGQMKADDPRNTLIVRALKVFEALLPEAMLIENVPQMLKTSIILNGETIKIVDLLTKVAHKHNYDIKMGVFNAADYGTAQSRKRAFIRIYKRHLTWDEPEIQPIISVRDAIGKLPSIESGQDSGIHNHKARVHIAEHILWMKHTATGKSALANPEPYFPNINGRRIKAFSSSYRRIDWHKPSPTITMCNGAISSQSNVHPGRKLPDGTYSDARALTILELCRLSGLPDNWKYPEWASDAVVREVIGEALMPNMLKALINALKTK